MAVVHSSLGPALFVVLHAVLIGFCGLAQLLAAMDLEQMEAVLAQAVVTCMHAAGMTHKEIAYYMRVDEAQLRRQLMPGSKQYLPLVRLMFVPLRFWVHFGPALMHAIWRREWAEVHADVHPESRRSA